MSNVTRYVRNPDSRLVGEVVSGGRRNWVLVDKKIQPDRITGGGDDLPRSWSTLLDHAEPGSVMDKQPPIVV